MLAGTLVFSVATVRDYHAWNRARWEALHFAVDDLHLPSRQIDGGFEFGGWALYDPHYKVQPNKSWWWVTDDEYMVTFGEVSGYHTIRTFPFLRWLPPGEGRIHLLQRDTRAGAASGRGT